MAEHAKIDVFALDGLVWFAVQPNVGPAYDFNFEQFFACRRPYERPDEVVAIGRLGAPSSYQETFCEWLDRGVRLVNSPAEHARASELPVWYPLLDGLTPRSAWFEQPPTAEVVQQSFDWPVFVKGARQTARHSAKLSIARNAVEYVSLRDRYLADDILHWQACVVREYVQLRPLGGGLPGKVPQSFEYRTFWWRGEIVGAGPYWTDAEPYPWTSQEQRQALSLGAEVAARLDVPFLVIDLAMTAAGAWIVIECNDAQESGYAGVSPFQLWNSILDCHRETAGA